jgi:hypothetical protein
VGLLPDVSLESARRVAASSYITVVDTFSLGDRRREEQRLDAILRAKPDLFIVAGGTDSGAREALTKLLETAALACHLMPPPVQTKVLYVGNPALKDKLTELFGSVASLHVAANVQPELGQETLTPARAELAKVYEELRLGQVGGFMHLAQSAGGHILPTAQAEGQMLRVLSRRPDGARGVFGVDVGSASTSLAAAFKGELFLTVRPDLGVGVHAPAVLTDTPLDQLTRWLPFDISEGDVRDYIHSKSAHPHTVPADANDLYLEHALARQVIRAALRRARPQWSGAALGLRSEVLPWLDQILGCGAVLGRAPRPGVAALLLLDALQPTGLTTLVLDPYHLAAALGAATYVNPLAVAQAIESGAFLRLGVAASLIGRGRAGEVACEVKLVSEGGAEFNSEVAYGSLDIIPLPLGQSGKLTLKPRLNVDAGFGPGRGKTLTVTGGAMGVMVDARSRPVAFPSDPAERRELVQQWYLKAGGV